MKKEGIKFDKIIFISVFLVCIYVGLVEEGWKYFCFMFVEYGIIFMGEYYSCFVDFFGCVGCLEEVEVVILSMLFKLGVLVWGVLFSVCRVYSDVERVECVVENVLKLDFVDVGVYVVLLNIYFVVGRYEDVEKIW